MKKKSILLFALITLILQILMLAGCQNHQNAGYDNLQESNGKNKWSEEEALKEVYSSEYILTDVAEEGKYLPPTKEVLADAQAFLSDRAEDVKDCLEKNKKVFETAAAQFLALSDAYTDREYYYDIADAMLFSSLITQKNAEEEVQRKVLLESLEDVTALVESSFFERVFLNRWSLESSFCEFSGALKLFDGIGCYVSLAYFSKGAPEKKNLDIQMLDEHWALITNLRKRDNLGQTVPYEKRCEVMEANYCKQTWKIYSYWLDNKDHLETIAVQMIGLCEQNPGYNFSYKTITEKFYGYGSRSNLPRIDDAPDQLLNDLKEVSIDPKEPIFIDICGVNSSKEGIISKFYGDWQFVDGEGYQTYLYYTPEEKPKGQNNSRVFKLDAHWYIKED